jgi:hypothetical protein
MPGCHRGGVQQRRPFPTQLRCALRTAAHMADDSAAGSAQCSMCAGQAATLWCHNDSAALCAQCDQSVHSRNPLAARHVRVPLCELCERLAATVYCRQVRVYPVDKQALRERWTEAPRAHTTTPAYAPGCGVAVRRLQQRHPRGEPAGWAARAGGCAAGHCGAGADRPGGHPGGCQRQRGGD